jgi:hypothetical protein
MSDFAFQGGQQKELRHLEHQSRRASTCRRPGQGCEENRMSTKKVENGVWLLINERAALVTVLVARTPW